MRLLLVELSRYFSRRAVVLVLLLAALLTAYVAASTIWATRPVTAEARASAQAQAQQEAAQPQFKAQLRECRDNPQEFFGDDVTADACDQMLPRAENYLVREHLDLRKQVEGNGVAVAVLVAALMVIAGTTFAGADWASGSLSNQLLFVPRRRAVWSAKAGAVVLATAVVAAVVLVAYWLALYLVAHSRGTATGAQVQEQVRWLLARSVLLAVAGGLGGYAMTMLLRHTVGTLGLLFAYAAGGEALLAVLPIDRSARWSPASNVFAWLRDGVRVYDDSVVCAPTQAASCDQRFPISLEHGATYLAVVLLLAVLVSLWSFHRRDVP